MSTPATNTWLFPGQGSQEIGMGGKLLQKSENARRVLQMAEEIANLPLATLMSRGPEKELLRSEVVQPAIVAVSCAYVDALRAAGEEPKFVAGHSLGEISALYAAGVLALGDALHLASERGRLMSQSPGGGMIAVKGVGLAELEQILAEIASETICLANLNAPSQLVVSGDELGLRALTAQLNARKLDSVRLNVSGAWHSPLVAVAAHEFEKWIACTPFHEPTVPVAMSSIAKLVTSGAEIKTLMMRQMIRPVRWFETINLFVALGCRDFYEVGCGKVLKGLMRRIVSVDQIDSIQGLDHGSSVERLLVSAAQRHAMIEAPQ